VTKELAVPEPLSLEELEQTARFLKEKKWLGQKQRKEILEGLENTAIIRSQRAWREITEASIALFLIKEHGLYLGHLNELEMPVETWDQYLQYMGRRGLARSTTFKHLGTLLVFHKGLGRPLEESLEFRGGVQALHHLKALVEYDQRTGKILGPKNPILLKRLPYPDEELDERLNKILDQLKIGKAEELELSPYGVAQLLRSDYGGQPRINFYWALGPFGQALAWYYSPDGMEEYRGIVGIDEMPQAVAYKLAQWARVTEKDPEPFAEKLLKEDKMFSEVIIVGNLGQDPEMRFTPNGSPVTNFSVATNRKWTNQDGTPGEETTWWRITCWGKLAEITNEYLAKGRPVLIRGCMNPGPNGGPRTWTGSDGEVRASYEVTAEVVRFLGSGSRREEEEPSWEEEEMEMPF